MYKTPYMVIVATKCGISVIYHSEALLISTTGVVYIYTKGKIRNFRDHRKKGGRLYTDNTNVKFNNYIDAVQDTDYIQLPDGLK